MWSGIGEYIGGSKKDLEKDTKKDDDTELGNTEADTDTNESSSLLGSAKDKINNKKEELTEEYSKPNYMMMFMFFASGCLFLLASMTALPFLLFSPAGFNMYFSLASFCFLTSVSFYHGPCNYLKKLFFETANLPITLLYLGSTGAALYFSIFGKIGYFYTLGLIGLQALSVVFFIIQAWTSGDKAQDKLKEFVNSGI